MPERLHGCSAMDRALDAARVPASAVRAKGSTHSLLDGLAKIQPLVLAIDASHRIVWMSDELGIVYGGAAQLIGRPVCDLVSAVRTDDDEALREQIRELVDGMCGEGHISGYHLEVGTKQRPLPIEVSAFRADDEAGQEVWVCIGQRLQRPRLQPTMSAPMPADSQLAFILESTPDGVVTIDRLGFVSSANAAAGQLLGQALEDLVDQPLSSFVAETSQAAAMAADLAACGEIRAKEIEITRPDGSRGWLSISATTRVAGGGDEEERGDTVVFIRDASERHEVRELLEKKNEELESYARSVSHDLRSPLSALLGFTRLLRDDYRDLLPETALHFLSRIEQAGQNMELLLHDLLELSRIGATPECRVHVNPLPVLEQLYSELRLQLDEKGIVLELPESGPTLLCDRTRLYQLLSNLIGNAIHHMGDQPNGRIEVAIDVTPGGWQITVADNGPGIRPEEQERIFEMFETGRPTTAQTAAKSMGRPAKKSSGLGLAIVKKIVETHCGQIRVESEPGAGARFIVFLPEG
ncbi:MAG: hypothetical protein CL908_11095 [Deltaproteobacteria bacterium]|nr:hypothetical protein [Deltaproteobacteria bacterium]